MKLCSHFIRFGLSLLTSCGGEAVRTGQEGADGELPAVSRPSGDQTVFSDIAVRIQVHEYEYRDGMREPSGPPIRLDVEVRVEINGGAREGRVPGLVVLAAGAAVPEFGSAGLPEQFSFQHHPTSPARNQTTVVELRYQGASFAVRTDTLLGEITAPMLDEVVRAEELLVIQWSGEGAKAPERVASSNFVSGTERACRTIYAHLSTADNEAIFAPIQVPVDSAGSTDDLPCTGEVGVEWSAPEKLLPSPFRSLASGVRLNRLRRFQID